MKKNTIVVLSNVTTGLVNFRNELLRILAQKYRVVIIAEDTGRSDELYEFGCEFDAVKLDRHGTNPFSEMKLISLYREKIRKYDPFVVLSYTIKPNIYGGIVCSQLKVPYLPNITGLGDAMENGGILSLVTRTLYRIGLHNAYKVFFQNQTNCNFFLDRSIYKGAFVVLPGSGVNLDKHCLEPYPVLRENKPLVLSVIGRITRDKGIDEILAASKSLDSNKVIIQLIGNCEGDYLGKIDEISKLGVIRFLGRQENIHGWIKNSHAVLHASYHEGMSNVLLEAAASGRPVIATNIPGCKETYDDGISGISFIPRDVTSLLDAINRFCIMPYAEKREMGIAGRRKMEQSFDRKIVVDEYLKTIAQIEGVFQNEPV